MCNILWIFWLLNRIFLNFDFVLQGLIYWYIVDNEVLFSQL